jgi:azurin
MGVDAMKNLTLCFGLCVVVLAGCSKKEAPATPSSSESSAQGASAAAAAPSAPAAGPREVVVTGSDTMKYDVTQIEAKAGEELKIVLKNAGSQPKQIMGHNLVLLKPGIDPQAFATKAATAASTGYIPADSADQIVAHTKLLGAKETDEIVLKGLAPGEYPYLCTFPGHFYTGMKGVLVVK